MKKIILLLILLNNFIGVAQTVVNGSFEQWGVVNVCEVNTPMDFWMDYSNGGIGADEANFIYCPTTIPPNASDSNVYARCFTATDTTGEGMYQIISGFTVGNVYPISFDYAGSNLYGGTSDCQWHLFIDDVDVNQTPVFHSTDAFWTPHVYSFTATNTTHKIGVRLYLPPGVPSSGSGAIDHFYIPPDSSAIALPVSNFIASDSAFCANNCISFSDMSTNATSWQWNFFGATPSSSTDANPQSICYNTAGTYDVTLITSNGSGSDTLTFTNYITVFPLPPTPTITQNGDTLFAPAGYSNYQWYLGSDTISGATDYFYVATQSGNYNLVVSNENGCSVGAGIVNVIAGEFGAVSSVFGVSVFPNPVKDELTIRSNQFTNCVIEIYNSIGEKTYSQYLPTANCKLQTANWSKGIYLLRISSGEKIFTKKIIIQK